MAVITAGLPREQLVRRARKLAWGGIAWHAIEFAVAIAAGLAAGSVALVAFGMDSLIESAAGFAVIWRLGSDTRERRAQQVIAASSSSSPPTSPSRPSGRWPPATTRTRAGSVSPSPRSRR